MQSPYSPLLPNKNGDILHWRKLLGAASSLSIAELVKQKQPIIYICSDAQHMPTVAKELSFFLNNDEQVFTFPDWECLPYDRVSPHPDIISQRLLALHTLPQLKQGILVIPITALMQRLAPTNYIHAHTFNLKLNDELDTEAFRQRLIEAGYYSVEQVMSPGEFAIRGGIVDVFPSGMSSPFRLDLFDTTIETIRLFDTETQRSTEQLEHIRLLPAREFPLDDQSIERFRRSFEKRLMVMLKNQWFTVKLAKV